MSVIPKATLSGTVLVRFLSSLELADVELANENFAERMSRLIGLSDSIKIAQAHKNVTFSPDQECSGELSQMKEDVSLARESMSNSIERSFNQPDLPGRLKMPKLKWVDDAPEFEPFQRFYMAHQRELEYRIVPLWSSIRDAVSEFSSEMAQLAAMDEVLSQSLEARSRDLFSIIPVLLRKRFDSLFQKAVEIDSESYATETTEAPSEDLPWLNEFKNDMQELLFAEMEVRMLPMTGLVEAVEYELQ